MTVITDRTQPEVEVVWDMVRRAVFASPVLLVLGFVIWGTGGLVGAAYGLLLITVNFVSSASSIAWAAQRSQVLLMVAVMGGYLFRLAFLFATVFPVRHAGWISVQSLCATMLVTHLGLLVWEIKFVSVSLAHPGLKPRRTGKKQGEDSART
ncbi:MAG: ATP synthase subunit I [Acidimicrobiales bacterium]